MKKTFNLPQRNQSSTSIVNKLNIGYFTGDKWNDIFNIHIYDFAYMNKLRNRSASRVRLWTDC